MDQGRLYAFPEEVTCSTFYAYRNRVAGKAICAWAGEKGEAPHETSEEVVVNMTVCGEIFGIQMAYADNPSLVRNCSGAAGFVDKVEVKISLLVDSRCDKLIFL